MSLAVIAALALLVIFPLGPWLILAAWFAALARGPLERLSRSLGGRPRGAAVLTVGLFFVLVGPMVVMLLSLSREAIDLAKRVAASGAGKDALLALVSPQGSSDEELALNPRAILELVQQHGGQAKGLLLGVTGAASALVIGLFIFFWGAHALLVGGPAAYGWFAARLPIPRSHFDRLASAFVETGRGLLIGTGLTGLSQALVATITYVALGVPRALVLGVMTLVASVIPSVGCALVWVPVAAGLLISGNTGKAIALMLIGGLVISTVDNILRPIFSRSGKLNLPAFVLLISVLGGVSFFGAWGLILGPLLARLSKEALDIAHDEQLWGEPRGESAQP